jgi:hypothetical protein
MPVFLRRGHRFFKNRAKILQTYKKKNRIAEKMQEETEHRNMSRI